MFGLTLFWSMLGVPLRKLIQTPLDKWIVDKYETDKLVNEIVVKVASLLEREDIFLAAAKFIKDTIRIDKILCFSIKKDAVNESISYKLIDGKNTLSIPATDEFIRFIETNKTIIKFKELPKSVKDNLKELKLNEKSLVIPFFSMEILEGFMLVDRKTNEDAYEKKDITTFQTIQRQLLLALDRIRPYEKIKADFEKTQLKLFEIEKLQSRSEKISSLSNLIKEYNHEIKHPISNIKMAALELFDNKDNLSEEKLKYFLDTINQKCARITDIVETTNRLSESRERHEVELDIKDVLNKFLQDNPPANITRETDFKADFHILGDIQDLTLMFSNLINNAYEAMPQGGKLTIKTYNHLQYGENYVAVEIRDTGCGIAAENLERMWEPFFSTHVTSGRGLGLPIVHRILREHLGMADVKSEVGKGSAFIIKLKALSTEKI
ncbi:MAG: ATP-binding protein [Candidatus Margulisbacteria bacterium]|nr:ATP-binding protein [Candidatus Margulisiibacteriota bacterium]